LEPIGGSQSGVKYWGNPLLGFAPTRMARGKAQRLARLQRWRGIRNYRSFTSEESRDVI
jgi:hypothetical protein